MKHALGADLLSTPPHSEGFTPTRLIPHVKLTSKT